MAGRAPSAKRRWALTICDRVNRHNDPDMYNEVPKRFLSLAEAETHDTTWFFEGDWTCSKGHMAARYLKNHAQCVDCTRIQNGKRPIYTAGSVDDLIGPAPEAVKPVANAVFVWSEAKKQQFFTAYVNTCAVPKALEAIGAQMSHLIAVRRENSAFREEMDRLEATDIRQAQFYRAEAAALESERMQTLQAQRRFPDHFGTGVRNDLGRPDVGTPEQIDAEFAQLIRGARVAGGAEGQAPPATLPGASGQPGPGLVEDGEGRDSEPDEEGGVPVEDNPNSDLVS